MTQAIPTSDNVTGAPNNAWLLMLLDPTRDEPYVEPYSQFRTRVREGLAATSAIPSAANTAPGNTPGSAAVGTSPRYARQDHDHGITPGSGGGGTTVAPHTGVAGDTNLTGITIGNTDYEIVDTVARADAQAAGQRANQNLVSIGNIGLDINGQVLTLLKNGNGQAAVTLPSGGGGDTTVAGLSLELVGTSATLTGTAANIPHADTGNVTREDLSDVFLVDMTYTRSNSDLRTSAIVMKAALAGTVEYKLQVQGSGGDYVALQFDAATDAANLTAEDEASGVSDIVVRIYNTMPAPASGGGGSVSFADAITADSNGGAGGSADTAARSDHSHDYADHYGTIGYDDEGIFEWSGTDAGMVAQLQLDDTNSAGRFPTSAKRYFTHANSVFSGKVARRNATAISHTSSTHTVADYFEVMDWGSEPSGLAPAGGSTGQVLKKDSNADYDYSWQADATGGGGAQRSREDTIDLLVGDTGGSINFTRDGSGSSSDLRGTIRNGSVNTAELANAITNRLPSTAQINRIPSASPPANRYWGTPSGSNSVGWNALPSGGAKVTFVRPSTSQDYTGGSVPAGQVFNNQVNAFTAVRAVSSPSEADLAVVAYFANNRIFVVTHIYVDSEWKYAATSGALGAALWNQNAGSSSAEGLLDGNGISVWDPDVIYPVNWIVLHNIAGHQGYQLFRKRTDTQSLTTQPNPQVTQHWDRLTNAFNAGQIETDDTVPGSHAGSGYVQNWLDYYGGDVPLHKAYWSEGVSNNPFTAPDAFEALVSDLTQLGSLRHNDTLLIEITANLPSTATYHLNLQYKNSGSQQNTLTSANIRVNDGHQIIPFDIRYDDVSQVREVLDIDGSVSGTGSGSVRVDSIVHFDGQLSGKDKQTLKTVIGLLEERLEAVERFRGPWNGREAYFVGQMVLHNLNLYICIRDVPGRPSPQSPNDGPRVSTTYWEAVSAYQGEWQSGHWYGAGNTFLYTLNADQYNEEKQLYLVTGRIDGTTASTAPPNNPNVVRIDTAGGIAQIAEWARTGNIDSVPAAKLPQVQISRRNARMVVNYDGADVSNEFQFPQASPTLDGAMAAADKAKLNTIQPNAQRHIQTDWAADPSTPAGVLNRPSIPTGLTLHRSVDHTLSQWNNSHWWRIGTANVSDLPHGAMYTIELVHTGDQPQLFQFQYWPGTTMVEIASTNPASDGWPALMNNWGFANLEGDNVHVRLGRDGSGNLYMARGSGEAFVLSTSVTVRLDWMA